MADVQIASLKKVGVPSTYVLPSAAEFVLKCVNADFDGSSAAGTYLPCVSLVSDSGHVIARAVDQNVSVEAGGDAEVSWFRGVRRRAGAAAIPDCALLGSANGTTTLTIPLTAAVPRDGLLYYVFCAATIGNDTDNNSADTAVVDSGGHGPWATTAGLGFPPKPVIGLTRQRDGAPGPATTAIVGAGCRACVAGDLGVGATITVTFGSTFPLLFHSAGLAIWQRAFFEGIQNNGSVRYGEGDSHPDFGASLTELSWDADYGPGIEHADKDALMITAMGAYPPVSGFVPFNGTKIGEIASGSVSIAAACAEVPIGDVPDMGGTWPAGAQFLMGNFQLSWPRVYS